jgi:hypothetical protein
VDVIEDVAQGYLAAVAGGKACEVPPKELENLIKKRKLVKQETWKTYTITKARAGLVAAATLGGAGCHQLNVLFTSSASFSSSHHRIIIPHARTRPTTAAATPGGCHSWRVSLDWSHARIIPALHRLSSNAPNRVFGGLQNNVVVEKWYPTQPLRGGF